MDLEDISVDPGGNDEDNNSIDSGEVDKDQPLSQVSIASSIIQQEEGDDGIKSRGNAVGDDDVKAKDSEDHANETSEKAEEDVNGGGNPEIFKLSEYLDIASVTLSKKDKWDPDKGAAKGKHLDWSQDDKTNRSIKNFPTIKGCAVLSILNGFRLMHGGFPNPDIKDHAVPIIARARQYSANDEGWLTLEEAMNGFVLQEYKPDGQPLITTAATISAGFGKFGEMDTLKKALCQNTERGLFCILSIDQHFVVVARQPNCTQLTYCDSWPETGSWAKDDKGILRGKGFLCYCDDFDELEAVLAVRHLTEMGDDRFIQCTLFSDTFTANETDLPIDFVNESETVRNQHEIRQKNKAFFNLAKSKALVWSFKESINDAPFDGAKKYGNEKWTYKNTCAMDTFLFLMTLVERAKIIPRDVLCKETEPFPEVIKLLTEESQSIKSVVSARKKWTWNIIISNGIGIDVCQGTNTVKFEERFNALRKEVMVDSGFGDQFQKLECAQVDRERIVTACSCGKDCPNNDHYEKVKNSRQKKRKSYVRAIPSDEKDFLDPEAAFKTPLKPTEFPCGKEENKDNVETVSEDEDAMVPTKSCNGQRTKYDVYRLRTCQRIVYFELDSTEYLPTPNITFIRELKASITLQDKRYLLIGIIFAERYHYSLIFVDNRNGVIGNNNIFYDGMLKKEEVMPFSRVDRMPHQVRGLVYVLDPQSVDEKSYTEQEEGGLTSPHSSAAEKETTAEDVTAAVKRLTTVQPNNKEIIASRNDEDTRTHFFKCPSNTTGFPSDKACRDMKELLVNVNERNWDVLTGGTIKGKQRRKYKMKFNRNEKALEEKIKAFMSPVIKAILEKHHPDFLQKKYRTKVGAIKSLPGAQSQYEGHGNKLHSDYPHKMLKKPFNDQPLSIIFALDSFEFIYLPDGCFSEDSLVTPIVERGQAVVFTNKCLHSGGKNDSNSDAYRLFAYVTRVRSDIPIGNVTRFHWDSNGNIMRDEGIESCSPTQSSNDKNPAPAEETESNPKAAQKEKTAEDATDEGKESCSPTQSSKDKVNDKNPAPDKETASSKDHEPDSELSALALVVKFDNTAQRPSFAKRRRVQKKDGEVVGYQGFPFIPEVDMDVRCYDPDEIDNEIFRNKPPLIFLRSGTIVSFDDTGAFVQLSGETGIVKLFEFCQITPQQPKSGGITEVRNSGGVLKTGYNGVRFLAYKG